MRITGVGQFNVLVASLALAAALPSFGCAKGTSGNPIGAGGNGGASTEAVTPVGGGGAGPSSGTVSTFASGSTGGASTGTISGPGPGSTTTNASSNGSTTNASTAAHASSSSGQSGCLNAEECGNTATTVCDPVTRACVPGECGVDPCPGTDVCLAQIDVTMAQVGACYPPCTILGGGCGSGNVCVPIELGGTSGACFGTGPGALNGACTQDDVTSGCAAGSVCVTETTGGSPICRQICSFYNSPSCGAGLKCDISEFCVGLTPDPSGIDGLCAASATDGTPCGANANKIQGACFGGICSKWCRLTGNDCPSGEFCDDVFADGTPVGLCD